MGRRMKQIISIAAELFIWRVAVYIRLSREDERKKDDSVSVVNQKKKIDSYIESSTENFIVVDYYIDDGKTGTNENRNGFQRMLRDIEDGKVNCIIVKDLSRAFRNYVDQGYFLENYFVQYKFRFISLELPMIDSFLFPETITSIAVPIQGVMNDNHAKETSLKVRSVFKTKREKGEFIGSFAPYGYKKSEEDHNKLVIDEPAAKIVRDIYNWYLSGKSKKAIVLELNERGIPNPATYKRKNGLKYENPSWSLAYSELWVFRTVDYILKDAKYIGDMVQGKQRVMSYKVKKRESIPQNEWFTVPNTHEAIIEKEKFLKVQSLLSRDTSSSRITKDLYLLAGFMRCADCKKAMRRKTSKGISYYSCSTHEQKKSACNKHTIQAKVVEKVLLKTIQTHMSFLISIKDLINEIKGTSKKIEKQTALLNNLEEKEKELAKVQNISDTLYMDLRAGLLTQREYTRMKPKFQEQEEQLSSIINSIKQKIEEQKNIKEIGNEYVNHFLKYQNIDCLTREMLIELVDTVYIHEDKTIEIVFKYQDQFDLIMRHFENEK